MHTTGAGGEMGQTVQCVVYLLTISTSLTAPQGFMMSYPILRTFTHHLAVMRDIPDKYKTPANLRPYGALIMAAQAVSTLPKWPLLAAHSHQVHRELTFWTTGERILPDDKKKCRFSNENWGDKQVYEGDVVKDLRSAGRFLKPLQKWGEERWEELYVATLKLMGTVKKPNDGSSTAPAPVEIESDADITSD